MTFSLTDRSTLTPANQSASLYRRDFPPFLLNTCPSEYVEMVKFQPCLADYVIALIFYCGNNIPNKRIIAFLT